MKRFLRWIALTAAFIVFAGIAFSLFAHFLVDYSLEDLELALSAASKNPEKAVIRQTPQIPGLVSAIYS